MSKIPASSDVLAYEETTPQPQPLPKVGERVSSYYLISAGVPIRDSRDQWEHVFIRSNIYLGPVDSSKARLFISSLPETNAPIIVDDVLVVNGRRQQSYAGVTEDPKHHLGEYPSVCYTPVEAPEVTRDIRADGWFYIDALDTGGWTYCSSRLYLRVVPR